MLLPPMRLSNRVFCCHLLIVVFIIFILIFILIRSLVIRFNRNRQLSRFSSCECHYFLSRYPVRLSSTMCFSSLTSQLQCLLTMNFCAKSQSDSVGVTNIWVISCCNRLHAIYSLKQCVNYFTEHGSHVCAAFLDCTKGFDRISHDGIFTNSYHVDFHCAG